MQLLSDPTIPLRITHAPLRLVVDERWCCNCGYELTAADRDVDDRPGKMGDVRRPTPHCPRCHSKRLVPATDVLLAGEYMLAS